MAILVTGGAGYIGSVCVEVLVDAGHDVVVVDNLQSGHRGAVAEGGTFYEGDFGSIELLHTVFSRHDIDAVLHFAASTIIEESITFPSLYYNNNIVKGIALLDTMMNCDCRRIIFSSSAAIFGDPQYVPVDEAHPVNPANPYAQTKACFEAILESYHQAYGIQYNSFRYFNAAGATSTHGDAHRKITLLIPVIMEVLLAHRDKLIVYGDDYDTEDGTCIRDYIHVLDLVQAHVKGLDRLDDNPNRVYNLGNEQGHSNREVIRAVERVTGLAVPYDIGPRRKGDMPIVIASSERAKSELEWQPRYAELDEIIQSAWEWHRRHPDGYRKS